MTNMAAHAALVFLLFLLVQVIATPEKNKHEIVRHTRSGTSSKVNTRKAPSPPMLASNKMEKHQPFMTTKPSVHTPSESTSKTDRTKPVNKPGSSLPPTSVAYMAVSKTDPRFLRKKEADRNHVGAKTDLLPLTAAKQRSPVISPTSTTPPIDFKNQDSVSIKFHPVYPASPVKNPLILAISTPIDSLIPLTSAVSRHTGTNQGIVETYSSSTVAMTFVAMKELEKFTQLKKLASLRLVARDISKHAQSAAAYVASIEGLKYGAFLYDVLLGQVRSLLKMNTNDDTLASAWSKLSLAVTYYFQLGKSTTAYERANSYLTVVNQLIEWEALGVNVKNALLHTVGAALQDPLLAALYKDKIEASSRFMTINNKYDYLWAVLRQAGLDRPGRAKEIYEHLERLTETRKTRTKRG